MDKRFGAAIAMVLVIAAAVVIISGCTSPTPTPAASPTPAPATNFSIVEMSYGEAGSLDPASSDSYDSASQAVIQAVYDTLFFFEKSDIATPVPMLATGYSISPDGLVYTITLRPNVKFHSGDPFNATAVKYSLDRLMLINNGQASGNFIGTIKGFTDYSGSDHTQADVDAYLAAEGVKIINNSAVQITLERANPDFIKMLTFSACSIINPIFDQAHGGYNATGQTGTAYLVEHEDGTGPFILDHWTHKTETALKRNDNYWGTKALPAMVYIKEVDDYNTRLLALQNGDADIIRVDQVNAKDVMNKSGIVFEHSMADLYVLSVSFNHDMWPWNNVKVRQAIAESIDYNTFIDVQLNGLAYQMGGPIPKGLLGYDPNGRLAPYNPTHAKQLLTEAGFSKSNATSLDIYYNTGNKNRQKLATMLKSTIEGYDLGITVNVKDMAWPQYTKAMDDRQLPCWIVAWGADFPGTDNFVATFLGPNGYYTTIAGYKNQTIFNWYNQTLTERDQAKLEKLYKDIVAGSFNDYPYAYVYGTSQVLTYREGLKGVYWNPLRGNERVDYARLYK